jgi:hypothetical protein
MGSEACFAAELVPGLISDMAAARSAGAATASRPAMAASPKNVLTFIFMNTLLDVQVSTECRCITLPSAEFV